MKKVIAALASLSLMIPFVATAQTKTITGPTKEVSGTIAEIDQSTRLLTVKLPEGHYQEVTAPPEMKRFNELKVGDKISFWYYENVVLRIKRPGEPDVDTSTQSTTPASGGRLAGTKAKQRSITATITAIDRNAPSITFTGPHGWEYSSKVQDTATLSKVNVGDKVDLTWTEALLVSVEKSK